MKTKDSISHTTHYESPLGGITLGSDGTALCGLWFDGQKYFPEDAAAGAAEKCSIESLPVFQDTKRWLDCYFAGERPDFLPSLSLQGSDFRKEVWEILLTIPYGQTMTYGEIAARIAEKHGLARMSAQAVGGAVGHNPVSILVPCHRVIGGDGNLTGYAGGIEKKRWLLTHEGYCAFVSQ